MASIQAANRLPENGSGREQRPIPCQRLFGKLPCGGSALVYTLQSSVGSPLSVEVTNYGATLVTVKYDGLDLVLGYDSLSGYLSPDNPYFGATIGRFANRIAHGRFKLHGEHYAIATNNNPQGVPCALHGGWRGFDKALWKVVEVSGERIQMRHVSDDGDEGYPGALAVDLVVSVTKDSICLEYLATTTRATPINLTNHSYWNLNGEESRSTVMDHLLHICAKEYTPVKAGLIPLGIYAPTEGTPLDFSEPVTIGARINEQHEQLALGNGYDHNYVVSRTPAKSPQHVATVTGPETGLSLEVHTTQPGLQFYSGNLLETRDGKGGQGYGKRMGFALETQHVPDSPNQEAFPNTILGKNEEFRSVTVYRFVRPQSAITPYSTSTG